MIILGVIWRRCHYRVPLPSGAVTEMDKNNTQVSTSHVIYIYKRKIMLWWRAKSLYYKRPERIKTLDNYYCGGKKTELQ